MKNIILMIFIVAFMNSCERKSYTLKKSDINFENLKSYSNHLHKSGLENINILNSKNNIRLIFANNPFNLNKEYHLTILADKKIVYNGLYNDNILVDLSEFENKPFHPIIGILTPKYKDKYYLHTFSNENSTFLENNYKYLYICFLLDNNGHFKMQLFPSKRWELDW